MCLDDQQIFWGMCPRCGEHGRTRTHNQICFNPYNRQPMPPRRRCQFGFPPNFTVHPLIIDEEGQEQLLTGPCEACIQEEQQTGTDAGEGDDEQAVFDGDDDEAESDHGEDDLDLLMSGANEESTGYADQVQQAISAERERREREEYAAIVDGEGASHLQESRARLRERFEAGTVSQGYGQERPVYFNSVFWTQEPGEIREALDRRAAHEVRQRHIYTGSDDAIISGESSSGALSYRPDLSGPPGRLLHPERMARYFQGAPMDPYDEPMAWQMQGCASTAEEEMLEHGYGENNTSDRWHNYWDDPTGYAETVSTNSASSRLEHLGEVESRNHEWYEGAYSWQGFLYE